MLTIPIGRGFLPVDDPLVDAVPGYEKIHEIAINLPEFYTEGTIREKVETLPSLLGYDLEGRQLDAVMRDSHFVAAAYYHTPKHKPPFYFPSNLARLVYSTAFKFKKKPILSYCSYALNNWLRRFDETDLIPENINILRKFTFTRDEEWFIIIHIAIEAEAESLLKHIQLSFSSKAIENIEILESSLLAMALDLEKMHHLLSRMREQHDPVVYATQVRLPIMPMKNIIFEGVAELKNQRVSLLGETGAQSSIVPSVRAALGINHEETTMTKFLIAHRAYMPPIHRKFIEEIELLTLDPVKSIRERVISAKLFTLVNVYNFALSMLYKFRKGHLELARDYIFKQILPDTQAGGYMGTGGTMADIWLKQLLNETESHYISWPLMPKGDLS